MPAAPRTHRRLVDENSLGVAKALAYVRGDITLPGAPEGLVPAGASDTTWLPIVGCVGLVVLTRDKRIRSRPLERQALLGPGVRACFLTSGGTSTSSTSSDCGCGTETTLKKLVATEPGRRLASVTRTGVRLFDTR